MVSYSLVTLHQGEPVTGSDIIAEHTQVQHKNVLALAREYQSDLEEFGTFTIKTRKSGGRPVEVILLNEPQATLLLTYMRNSDIARTFKKALVKAFFELRAAAAQPNPVNNTMLSISKDRYIELLESQVTLLQQRLPVTKKIKSNPLARPRLSDEEKSTIVRLRNSGLGVREIARRTGRSKATVSYLTRHVQGGTE